VSIRPIDPDAEAARLAEERKRATERADAQWCRFCHARPPVPLMRTADGWQCLDGIDCHGRQSERSDG
jgi:hypothetical protein